MFRCRDDHLQQAHAMVCNEVRRVDLEIHRDPLVLHVGFVRIGERRFLESQVKLSDVVLSRDVVHLDGGEHEHVVGHQEKHKGVQAQQGPS